MDNSNQVLTATDVSCILKCSKSMVQAMRADVQQYLDRRTVPPFETFNYPEPFAPEKLKDIVRDVKQKAHR